MTRSNTNYRTAMVALTAGDSIREAHSYEYGNNGNIVYVNTSRVKPDMTTQPDTVQRARDKRLVFSCLGQSQSSRFVNSSTTNDYYSNGSLNPIWQLVQNRLNV